MGIEYFAVPKAFGIMMTNAMTKMYRHPKQQGERKIYNNWNDGQMTSTAAAKVSWKLETVPCNHII